MFRKTALRFQKTATAALRRNYTNETSNTSAHKLAEEALAQKTGTATKSRATLPKGDKKPTKAKGEKDNNYKEIALTAGAVTGLGLGGLFYYGMYFLILHICMSNSKIILC
jgi:import inner membrane translocase subunit TIM50